MANAQEAADLVERLLTSLEERPDRCVSDEKNWPKDEDEAYDRVLPPGKAASN